MKRMLANRAILLGVIVLCATALVGAAGLFVRSGKPAPPAAAAKPGATPVALTAKQTPAQDPRCALQDKDDDDDDDDDAKGAAKESKVKQAKPDTDDDELECGDQNDDDGGVNEDKDREHGTHGEHGKKVPEKKGGNAGR